MDRKRARVMVASEFPELRRLLKGVVESGGGMVEVSEADNAARALAVANRVRPDVALIDCHLPRLAGNDRLPLSRISGLDIAEAIQAGNPGARVVLVTDVDEMAGPADFADCVWELRREGNAQQGVNLPVLARLVVARGRAVRTSRPSGWAGTLIWTGALAIVGGAGLAVTLIFAPAGALLAGAGAVAVLAGVAGRSAFKPSAAREKAATAEGGLR